MAAPALALLALFVFYPLFENFRIAFYNWDSLGRPGQFVGLANFGYVLTDSYFWNAVRHTAIFAISTVTVGMIIATLFAIWLNDPRLRGRSLLRTLIFLPAVTSSAILGIVFSLLLNPLTGPLDTLLTDLGLVKRPIDWLGNGSTVLWVVIVISIWQGLGIGLIVITAGLQSIDPEIYEAAACDGAVGIRKHWYVTLPMIRPVLVTVFLISMLGSIAVFDLVLTLTGGGPDFASDVVATYVFRYASGQGFGQATRIGYAAAAGLFMSAIILLATFILLAARRVSQRRQS